VLTTVVTPLDAVDKQLAKVGVLARTEADRQAAARLRQLVGALRQQGRQLSSALVVLLVSPAQAHERETAVATLSHCRVDQEPAHTRTGQCGERPGPSCKVKEPAQPDNCVASRPKVAAWPTPPVPPANLRCEAPEPRCETRAPRPCPGPTTTHTLTIRNGAHVERDKFVWRNGAWHSCGEVHNYDVFVRDCPRSPWHLQGTYRSPRRAEEVACSLRAHGNLTEVRPHCG
jgi:uncharacterized low-complexity protein